MSLDLLRVLDEMEEGQKLRARLIRQFEHVFHKLDIKHGFDPPSSDVPEKIIIVKVIIVLAHHGCSDL